MLHKDEISVYFAGPLFTQAEWQWNERLAEELRKQSLHVILPQAGARPMLENPAKFNAESLFRGNISHIEKADAVIAVLDGPDVDSGTAWECGYAFKAGRPVIGLRTDFRAGGDDPQAGINLMLSRSCASILSVPLATREDVGWVAREVVAAIRGLIGKNT